MFPSVFRHCGIIHGQILSMWNMGFYKVQKILTASIMATCGKVMGNVIVY